MKRSRGRHTPSSGFTLIELLVVVSIIALLISILLPSLGKAKELANRAYCAANLRGLMQSMVIYDQDGEQGYPTVLPAASNPGTSYNNGFTTSTFSNDPYFTRMDAITSRRGSAVACLWLLSLNGNSVPPKMFLCKSDRWIGSPSQVISGGQYYENFQGPDQISYSLAFPFSSSGARALYWNGKNMESTLPLLSDMAPFSGDGDINTTVPQGSAPYKYTSPNHELKGQCVAYGDIHVDWTIHPYVGQANDNIWTVGAGGGTAIGQSSLPSALVSNSNSLYDIAMVPVRKASDGTLGP
jgi:prepilin-type N-terminal cleavage/methylation domain-containing protein